MVAEIKRELIYFFQYLRSPRREIGKENISLDLLTVTYAIFFLIAIIPSGIIMSLAGLEDVPHALTDMMDGTSFFKIFLLAVVLAPIAEELIFRFHLKYPIMTFLFLFATAFGIWFSCQYTMSEIEQLAANDTKPVVMFLGLMVSMLILYFVWPWFRIGLNHSITRFFGVTFYATAAIFAFVHIYNFDITQITWYLAPLFVLPQFIIGLFLGYVRVRNDIFSSIYVHALNNAIPMFFLWVSTLFPELAVQ